ncbi:hypothetical protein AVEN_148236-1 [Araneus ventricosus]|uniref:Uncharacterized protein n=1 Tax=Araneus ventricosus TaxID=182803 RepID=A0A4Y2IFP6_ARAVE|nr:hypothetical protein AVEN_148236-1 [Araneus ventricosus]
MLHSWRAPHSTPDPIEDLQCMWTCFTLNHTQRFKRPPKGECGSMERGVPSQVSSSSSDRSSKLQKPFQNSPCDASKYYVNLTKLISSHESVVLLLRCESFENGITV